MKFDSLYYEFAKLNSNQSHDTRAKVGCVIVNDDRIISNGWNGTPAGEDNACQDENGVTKENVVHAEMNAIYHAARDGQALRHSTMYCTHSPCVKCSRAIKAVGITRLVYGQEYRDCAGLEELVKSGIKVTKFQES